MDTSFSQHGIVFYFRFPLGTKKQNKMPYQDTDRLLPQTDEAFNSNWSLPSKAYKYLVGLGGVQFQVCGIHVSNY